VSECFALGLETDAALGSDPRLLSDPRRLGDLHSRLAQRVGDHDADLALLQGGFLQGLRDALRGVHAGFAGGPGPAPLAPLAGPRIAFDLRPMGPGGVDAEGVWRGSAEAEGHVAACGRLGRPVCFATAGYTSGWLSGLLDRDVIALEVECSACGAPACRFRVRSAQAWAHSTSVVGRAVAASLDFDALRDAVGDCDEDDALEATDHVDPELPVVHVWGPVMVVPYSGANASISALDLIEQEAMARDVSVVVLDLSGAYVDPEGGALGLERVVDAIERRGADAVLAGLSEGSRAGLAALMQRHLTLHDELPLAIAAAFQIADAQRRVY
jgi:hypothetical protein